MQFHISDGARGIEVALKGRLEFDDHANFREVTAKVTDLPAKDIIVDLSGVEFIDSSGLGLLIVLRNLAERRKVVLVLKKATGVVRQMLVTTRFDMLARIED